ncbi:enterochelin esterase-like enzyme [Thermosporothrix hazakensis]|jgi:enterochelin esterase-like enzyme|uniref:Enterochelin esterase-like enzyme n=2 Tax=Thermosporothrix TaxID=768650 RepID=A0A326TYE5_THEHA|nr:alpha/beta hydrolase-fold protein [Thermosporothrix hazakensis]PZW22390.1 enterochelin esterase-like enzyme [Thermosporothrix hazakensis]BBH91092.1 hypothetical protein KTC_58430 [Thermosporothrix sp. COM3]GCE49144.1 hypothetical protein KTH_40130 [Thermosporothrix hazakensis]
MRKLLLIVPQTLTFLLALLLGSLLVTYHFQDRIITALLTVGLDPQRSLLTAMLALTALSGLLATILFRRKGGAILGSGLVFAQSYLIPFLQEQLQPQRDPGGHLLPLDQQAFIQTALIMSALALLSAFIGSAVGQVVGEVLLDPCYTLAKRVYNFGIEQAQKRDIQWARNWEERRHKQIELRAAQQTHPALSLLGKWTAALFLVLLIYLSSQSVSLFLFAPDVGLHKPPQTGKGGEGSAVAGTVLQDSVISKSLQGQRRTFMIYLPPSYYTKEGAQLSYPVLYLLHGAPGRQIDWIQAGSAVESANTLINLGQIHNLIMVFPDGNGRPGPPSEWANTAHNQNMEDFIVKDLVPYVDSKYRTEADSEHRAIGGLSMGGYGATNIGVHHPELFGTVITLGGYYKAEGDIWNKDQKLMQANSPQLILPNKKEAWNIRFYVGAATKDQPYYTYAQQFVQLLKKYHITYTLDVQKGYHSWSVWRTQLYNALLWLHWQDPEKG